MPDDGEELPQVPHGSVRAVYPLSWSDRVRGVQMLIRAPRSNLMAPDEFRNLGFAEEEKNLEAIPSHAGGATAHKVRDDGKKIT